MSSGLALGGLVSGMSTDEVIQKLLDAESVSKNREVTKKTQLQAKQASWKKVKTQLQTLRSKLDAIRFSSGFQQRSVTVSDDQYLTAKAAAGATITDHRISISSVATAQSVVGASSMADTTTALGLSGVITIRTAKDTTPHDVTLDGTESLMGLRDKINASGAQVQADVITVINGGTTSYQLKITSKVLGSDGAITMSDNKSGALLADAKINLQSAPGTWVKNQSATDAIFKLDGNDYVMSTNEISGVVPGLTLSLKKAQAAPSDGSARPDLSLKVAYDPKPTVTAIQDWAKAINDTISLVKTESAYANGDTPAGNLMGESLCRSIEQNLRSKFSLTYGSGSMNTLSAVGVTTGAWKSDDYGKLVVDADKLTQQLNTDPDAVARLFGAASGSTTGVALDSYSYVNGLLAFQVGDIDTKNDTLDKQIKETTDRISDMTAKLADRETQLRAQFTRMETAMSQLQTQGNAFMSQITSLLGNNNSK